MHFIILATTMDRVSETGNKSPEEELTDKDLLESIDTDAIEVLTNIHTKA